MKKRTTAMDKLCNGVVLALCFILIFPFQMVADINSPYFHAQQQRLLAQNTNTRIPVDDRISVAVPNTQQQDISTTAINEENEEELFRRDTLPDYKADSIPLAIVPGGEIMLIDSLATDTVKPYDIHFNPDPTRAVWLSALFPGLGQIYNRRYWKLPIVAGGFLGISYALSWNNRMLSDYTIAYRDAMDNDPNTKSYLDFFPSTMKEEDIDMNWLQKTLKSRKDFYRRNRDLSIICMVGMYLLCMVDAYVDASLSHFDITPDLSMNVFPAIIDSNRNGLPSVGIAWALNF